MNPTLNKITFFSRQDFVSFVEKFGSERYGKDKNDFCLDWLGLSNDSMIKGYFEGGKSSQINALENSITFMTKWFPALAAFHRMEGLGINFNFYSRSKNGEGCEGYVKDKKYFLAKIFDQKEECADEVFCDGERKLVWNKNRKSLTIKNAGLNSALKKATGEYGIISEFLPGRIKVSAAQIGIDGPAAGGGLIAEYKSMDALLADGWAIDLYDSRFLCELNPHEDDEAPPILL